MRVVLSFVGIVSGVVLAVGVLVLLQQQGTVFPTRNVAIIAVVLGVLAGVLLPSIAKTTKTRR